MVDGKEDTLGHEHVLIFVVSFLFTIKVLSLSMPGAIAVKVKYRADVIYREHV